MSLFLKFLTNGNVRLEEKGAEIPAILLTKYLRDLESNGNYSNS